MSVTPSGSVAAAQFSFAKPGYGGTTPTGSVAAAQYSFAKPGYGGVTPGGSIATSVPYAGSNIGMGGVTPGGTIAASYPYGNYMGYGGVTPTGSIAATNPYVGTPGSGNLPNNIFAQPQPGYSQGYVPPRLGSNGSLVYQGIPNYPAYNNTFMPNQGLYGFANDMYSYNNQIGTPNAGYGYASGYMPSSTPYPAGSTAYGVPNYPAYNNTLTGNHPLYGFTSDIYNYNNQIGTPYAGYGYI